MHRYRQDAAALAIFIFLTVLMTFPVAFNMRSAIPGDLGDPLGNLHVMAWDTRSILSGFRGFWDLNSFYPYKGGLAFGENQAGSALLGLPFVLAGSTPLFVYNSVFLLSFILTGYFTFLLVRHLTGSFWPGMAAGIIFAFFPFRFASLGHINSLNMQWIPLVFLFLHKYVLTSSPKYLAVFAAAYVFQCLSCLQYGIMLTVFLAMFFAFFLARREFLAGRKAVNLVATLIAVGTIMTLFMLPYVKARTQFNFSRGLAVAEQGSAQPASYLAPSCLNRFYRDTTFRLWQHGALFAGFTALLLAFAGMGALKGGTHARAGLFKRILLAAWKVLILFYSFVAVLFLFHNGGPFFLRGREVLKLSGITPFADIILLLLARYALDGSFRKGLHAMLTSMAESPRFYFVMSLVSAVLSFGPRLQFYSERAIPGPYLLLYQLLPGFSSIRMPLRFGVLAVFAVSVLAGYGLQRLQGKITPRAGKAGLTAAVMLLLLAEYRAFPVPDPGVLTGTDVPEVYRWLAGQKGDFAVIELPMHSGAEYALESQYMYYSTYHWKRLANGYSSYMPPLTQVIYDRSGEFPSAGFVGILRRIGIRYAIVHRGGYEPRRLKELDQKLQGTRTGLVLARKFGDDLVYSLSN